jgi:hypothetical protein
MDPTMYAMIENVPFSLTIDPGLGTYNNIQRGISDAAADAFVRTIMGEHEELFLLVYENVHVHLAFFRLLRLDDIVRPEYKVSNIPG